MMIDKPLTAEEIAELRYKEKQEMVRHIMDDLNRAIARELKSAPLIKTCTVGINTDNWYIPDSKALEQAQGEIHLALSKRYKDAKISVRYYPDRCWALCWKPLDGVIVTLVWT